MLLSKGFAVAVFIVWLVHRLAAMRIVPQAPLSMPPMTQPGHGLPDGPLADLSAKLAASSSNTFPQDPTPGLSGTIPQVCDLQQTPQTPECLCAMRVVQERR